MAISTPVVSRRTFVVAGTLVLAAIGVVWGGPGATPAAEAVIPHDTLVGLL